MKFLKNIFLFIALTSAIISCTSDDEPRIATNSEKIIGTWELNEFLINGKSITTVGNEDPIEALITSTGKTFTNTIQKYTSKPNKVEASGSFVLVTITKIGETEETKEEIADFDSSDAWTINGNELTISSNGEADEVYEILTLTDKILSIKKIEEETITVGSTTIKTNLTATISFKKN